MKIFKRLPLLVLTVYLFLPKVAFASDVIQIPDGRDQQVLQALLSHLRADTNFNLTRTHPNPPTIVLQANTPEKTGFLSVGQIRSDLRTNSLPTELEDNLRRRNTPPDAAPNSYEAVSASYTNLTFSSGIVIADLKYARNSPLTMRAFEEAYPAACGFVRAYLPGYSADGNMAVARASVGPTPHGATITALLEKTGNTWTVKWYRLARYL